MTNAIKDLFLCLFTIISSFVKCLSLAYFQNWAVFYHWFVGGLYIFVCNICAINIFPHSGLYISFCEQKFKKILSPIYFVLWLVLLYPRNFCLFYDHDDILCSRNVLPLGFLFRSIIYLKWIKYIYIERESEIGLMVSFFPLIWMSYFSEIFVKKTSLDDCILVENQLTVYVWI